MIVLDASAALDFLLWVPPHGETVAARIRASGPALAAPHLLDAEVAQVLRRFVRREEIPVEVARAALEDLDALPIVRYPHGPLLHRAFDLRNNATIYDALYLVLAEALDAPLLTRDASLAAIPGHLARVEVVG